MFDRKIKSPVESPSAFRRLVAAGTLAAAAATLVACDSTSADTNGPTSSNTPSTSEQAPTTATSSPDLSSGSITVPSTTEVSKPSSSETSVDKEKVDLFTSEAYTSLAPEQQALVKKLYEISYADFLNEPLSKTAIFSDVVSRAYGGMLKDAINSENQSGLGSWPKWVDNAQLSDACINVGVPLSQIGTRFMTADVIAARGGSVDLAKKLISGAIDDKMLSKAGIKLSDVIHSQLTNLSLIKQTTGAIDNDMLKTSFYILQGYMLDSTQTTQCVVAAPNSTLNSPFNNGDAADTNVVYINYGDTQFRLAAYSVKNIDGSSHVAYALLYASPRPGTPEAEGLGVLSYQDISTN